MRPPRLTADDFICAGIAAFAAALTNLSLLSKGYVLEGLARAIPIELGQFHSLFNGNYVLYGFLGNCFHHLLRAVGYSGLAVGSLQIMDGLLGGCGIFVFFLILRRLRASCFSAFVWSAVLAFSFGYWHWSTEAEDYIFSTFLLTLNFLFLLLYLEDTLRSPVLLGALHALAVMGHIINGVFAPVVLWFLYCSHPRSWKGPALRYLVSAALMILAVYSSIFWFILRARTWPRALAWVLGDAGMGTSLRWHGSLHWLGLWQWIRTTLNVFVSFAPSFRAPPAWTFSLALLPLACALLAVHCAAVVLHRRRIAGDDRSVAVACVLWVLLYALIFTSWEPGTLVYRVSDLVPLCVLLFLGSRAWQETPGASGAFAPRLAAAAFAVCLCAGNLGSEIYPLSFASNNPRLVHMAFLKDHTPAGSWIAGDGGDEINIPYFAARNPVNITRYLDNPAGARNLIDELFRGRQRVFVTSRVLNNPLWAEFLRPYRPELTALGEDGYGCYELHRA